MASDVERLLRAIPIESYIQRYLPLKKKGANLWAVCPFHSEKSPSFSVSPEKGIFKCFGCGKGGNLISFVQDYERVDFREALKILSEYSGIPLEGRQPGADREENIKKFLLKISETVKDLYQSELTSGDGAEAREYLKKRNITQESVRKFILGYAPAKYRYLELKLLEPAQSPEAQKKAESVRRALSSLGLLGENADNQVYNRFRDRLIFPIRNMKGETIAFGGRIIRAKENAGKYINSPENPLYQKKNTLYHLFEARNAIREEGQVILVEGYLDVIGLSQAGIENTVAPLGTAFTEEQAQLIKRYTDKLLIFFDGDSAGVDASFKALQAARKSKLQTRVVAPTHSHGNLDPFDISQKLDAVELLTLLDNARSEVGFILWYFFSHHYNISRIEEKREAMERFFEYLGTLEHHWEKIDYLKEAAAVLQIDPKALEQDYRKSLLETGGRESGGYRRPEPEPEEAPRPERPSPLEMEILGLLLRFPAFWEKKTLLEELELTQKNIYLLFSFFRDRLKAGEFWNWDRLSEVMSLLPRDLGAILAEILLKMEEALEKDNPKDNEEESREASENSDFGELEIHYGRKLERLIFLHKKERLAGKIRELQQRLVTSETLGEEDADALTLEISETLADKRKVEEFLANR